MRRRWWRPSSSHHLCPTPLLASFVRHAHRRTPAAWNAHQPAAAALPQKKKPVDEEEDEPAPEVEEVKRKVRTKPSFASSADLAPPDLAPPNLPPPNRPPPNLPPPDPPPNLLPNQVKTKGGKKAEAEEGEAEEEAEVDIGTTNLLTVPAN